MSFPVMFSIVITSLGEDRAGLYASCAFVGLCIYALLSFSLPLGIGGWLVIVIVTFPEVSFHLLNILFVVGVPYCRRVYKRRTNKCGKCP